MGKRLQSKVKLIKAVHGFMIQSDNQTSLVWKWMPRKGTFFNALRKSLNMTPKELRKLLVQYTNVVETLMTANQWNMICYIISC